jgi:hypothetical protein
MAHAMALTTSAVTGSRPSVPGRWWFRQAVSAARTVRTREGMTLFDERGRYVGTVTAPPEGPRFGAGARAVLLRR